MAGLFILFLICLILIFRKKSAAAFTLVAINLILSFFMLLRHAQLSW